MIDYKLHIPGPVNVAPETYDAMSTPVMGHRSKDFVDLYQACQPNLQKLFQTDDPVFLSTSSAWGAMEGSVRNLSRKKVLCCMCGAFSDKWLDVSADVGNQRKDCRLSGASTLTLKIFENIFLEANTILSRSFTTKPLAE